MDFSADRIRRAERKQRTGGYPNLHFLHGEGGELFEAVPPGIRFHRVLVLFPDPWPKRRHRKNRLLNAKTLERLTELCEPGATFYFRSDALEYVADVTALLARHAAWRVTDAVDLPISEVTIFQQKAPTYATVVACRS